MTISRFYQRAVPAFVASIFLTAFLAAMALFTVPANAAPWGCSASNTGSGGLVNCSSGGPGGGGYSAPNTNYHPVRYYNEPCVDRNGNLSQYVDMANPSTGASLVHYCMTVFGNGNGGVNLKAEAEKLVPAPKPKADFNGDFLTGAKIQFDAGPTARVTAPVPGVPGALLEARPIGFEWDFGDGTKGSGGKPTHVYESTDVSASKVAYESTGVYEATLTYVATVPNTNKPGFNNVHVTVTSTWHLYFHPPGADPVNGPLQDLGTVAPTGSLDRPIVQVWSAQTEPMT